MQYEQTPRTNSDEYKKDKAKWRAAQSVLKRIKAFHKALGNVTAKPGDNAAALAAKLATANRIAADFEDVVANVPKQ